jgi:CRP-like cAMP-binding protein
MKAPVRLRQVAIASNVAFFSYGLMAHAYPVAVLLEAKVRAARNGEFSLDWIGNFGTRRDFKRGEMLGFSADRKRSMSAQCETDVELLAISASTVSKLFYQDPRFGFYLIRLITQRLEQDVAMLNQLLASRRA